jgi:hypothetical protein
VNLTVENGIKLKSISRKIRQAWRRDKIQRQTGPRAAKELKKRIWLKRRTLLHVPGK